MNFEIGNYYKTRNGKKAIFVGEVQFCYTEEKLLFEVEEENEDWSLLTYESDGKYKLEKLDIISEWEDKPKKIAKIPTELLDKLTFGNIDDVICDRINRLVDAINKLQEKQ